MPRLRQIVSTVKGSVCAGCAKVIKARRMAVIVIWKIGDSDDPEAIDLEGAEPDVLVQDGELRVVFPQKMPLAEPFRKMVYHIDGCGVVTHDPIRRPVSGDAGRGKRTR